MKTPPPKTGTILTEPPTPEPMADTVGGIVGPQRSSVQIFRDRHGVERNFVARLQSAGGPEFSKFYVRFPPGRTYVPRHQYHELKRLDTGGDFRYGAFDVQVADKAGVPYLQTWMGYMVSTIYYRASVLGYGGANFAIPGGDMLRVELQAGFDYPFEFVIDLWWEGIVV